MFSTEEITVVSNIASDLATLLQVTVGRWKIANNQMLFYDADGVTVLYTYNLLDADGAPTMTSVFERTPA